MGAAPPLSRRGRRVLVGLVALGVLARLVVAFVTYGVAFDIESLALVGNALLEGGTGPYDFAPPRWPYPSGFFGLVVVAEGGSRLTGLPFHGLVQVPAIVADAVLALLVAHGLRVRGQRERTALSAAAAVALGPSFAVISGFHGQIDSVAILPAVVGVLVWERLPARRALTAGALVGLGAAMKWTPAFCALALLPTARSWRERAGLVTVVGATPVLATAPWLLANPRATVAALSSNQGVMGFGGPSAFLQPELTRWWSTFAGAVEPSRLLMAVTGVQNVIVAVAVLAVTVLLMRRRVAPLPGAVAIWLTVFAVNPNFAYQYLVWGLPFLLLAGHVRAVVVLQAGLLPATVLFYFRPEGVDQTGWLYFAAIQGVYLALVAAAAIVLRRVATGRSTNGSPRAPRRAGAPCPRARPGSPA